MQTAPAATSRHRFHVHPVRIHRPDDDRAGMRILSDAVMPSMSAEDEAAAFANLGACLDAAWSAALAVIGGDRPAKDGDWQALRNAQAEALAVSNPGETSAIRRTEASLKRSVDRLVRANIPLTIAVATQLIRSRPGSMSVDDAVQEASIGVLKAIRRFDVSKGLRLSTYAVQWMRHHVGRAYVDTGKTIRIPSHINETGNAIRRAAREMGAHDVASAIASDLPRVAALAGRTVKAVIANSTLPRAFSGEEKMPGVRSHYEDSDTKSMFDLVPDPTPAADVTIADEQVHSQLLRAVDTLPATQAIVLRRRFGLDGNEPETLQQIAETFDLSRERIRQIEVAALRRAAKACPGLAGVVSL